MRVRLPTSMGGYSQTTAHKTKDGKRRKNDHIVWDYWESGLMKC